MNNVSTLPGAEGRDGSLSVETGQVAQRGGTGESPGNSGLLEGCALVTLGFHQPAPGTEQAHGV